MVKLLHHRAAQGLNFAGNFFIVVGNHGGRFDRGDIGYKVRLAVFNFIDGRTLVAFDQDFDGSVWQLEHLQNGRDASDIKHVRDYRIIFGRRLLGHQHDAPLGFHRSLEGFDALGASHKQGNHHMRKHHHVAQGQQGQINRSGWQGRGIRHKNLSRISD